MYDKISVTPDEYVSLSSFVMKEIMLTSMARKWSLPWS